ncbi:unnamed protein product [Pieris brassicae]|uniref:PHD-type domain-containing protein n=1 Tax=Pieris brassicae TaxID=7116 RepID=A0A9P0TTU6_PIEBR|nr:unnamed protein product [Pieris brassicae]CAH4038312.1 unnamed protein product [Pieris brassicae]CAH4038313.1 unnamed protein product [Pieris brassicae]
MDMSDCLNNVAYTCGRCAMIYYDYKQLLEHLYWRHGTESVSCNKCLLKQWAYAAHICHVLPIDESQIETTETYCFCAKITDSPMIGCDGPNCKLQWYHFECVGIVKVPAGSWYCPACRKH